MFVEYFLHFFILNEVFNQNAFTSSTEIEVSLLNHALLMHALKTNEKVFSKQLARLVQTSTPVASLYHKNKLGNIFLTGRE